MTEPKGELADLYVRHVPAANRLGFLLTGDRVQAEDLVHDAVWPRTSTRASMHDRSQISSSFQAG